MSLGIIAAHYADAAGGGGGSYSYTNPSPTGLLTLVANNDPAEYLVAGMDATGLTPGVAVDIELELWIAHSDPGTPKASIARLRDGGPTGTVLATKSFGDAGDSTGGHQQVWRYAASVAATSDRLCVTIQQTNGTPQITSDTRSFLLESPNTVDAAAVRATQATYSGAARPIAVNIPAAAQVGDLLVVSLGAAWDVTTTAPAGWTKGDVQNGTWFNGGLFWKIAEAGDPGSTVTIGLADWTPVSAFCWAISGAESLTVLGAQRVSNGWNAGWTLDADAIAGRGDLLLYGGFVRLDSGAGAAPGISRGSSDANVNAGGAVTYAHRHNSEAMSAPVASTVTFTCTTSDNGHYFFVARANRAV